MSASGETLLDTSAWLALAAGDVRLFRMLRAQGGRAAVLSVLSIGELASLAQRGRMDAAWLDAAVKDARLEQATLSDCLEGGRLHGLLRRRGHPKVSLADCIIYAGATRLGIPLLTLDGDLAGLPGVEVLDAAGPKA